MDTNQVDHENNRRSSGRLSAKRSVRIACYANALGLGPNVALSLLDVSETGARVAVKQPLALSQLIELNLSAVGLLRPIKVIADVVWCVATTENEYQIGLNFQQHLTFRDLQELGR